MLLIGLFVIFSSVSVQADNGLLKSRPPWLINCKRNDPQINDCIKNLLNTMFPYMAKGIPEVGLDRFEPLYIDRIYLSKGQGAVVISGSFTDILVQGPSKAEPGEINVELDKNKFNFALKLPDLHLKSHYSLKGHILVLPIVGDGKQHYESVRNATSVVRNVFELLPVDGREIMQVTDVEVDFHINKTEIHLDNLFNGNKVLGQTLNAFLNKNSEEIVNELRDSLSDSLSGLFKRIFNDLFKHLPTDLWLTKE